MNLTRAMPRLPRQFKVAVNGASAVTLDVSSGGFCALLTEAPQQGTSVSGSILVRGHSFPFSGRVAWTGADRMGVCFTQIPPTFAESAGWLPPDARPTPPVR